MASILEHSFFFTAVERDSLSHEVSHANQPPSILTWILYPLWHAMSKRFIPESVAPNAITLISTLCAIQAYQVTNQYYTLPGCNTTAVSAIAITLLMISLAATSIDGVHAKRCHSSSPLGDIFARICANANEIFFALTLFDILEITDVRTRWYLTLSMQVFELNSVLAQINARNLRHVPDRAQHIAHHMTYWIRDSESCFAMMCMLLLRCFVPSSFFTLPEEWARYGYLAFITLSVTLVCLMRMKKRNRFAIATCLLIRVLPIFLLLPLSQTTVLSIIADAVVLGTLTVEVYASHMANRRINAAVIAICVGSLFSDVLSLAASILYLVGLLVDISYSTRVPLFVPIRNVFIDGVYDLCHIGHKRVMENALAHGNRLLVGILSDEDCVDYKRRPIMTLEERIAEVRSCKYVYRVIPGSPVDGLTREFLEQHNVHVVVCGEEYDKPDDKYYAVPRAMGILKIAPRTEGMSTSVLINRIKAQSFDDLAPKDKLNDKSSEKPGG